MLPAEPNIILDRNDVFHYLEAIKSCAINLFFFNFSNSKNQLIGTLIGCGSMFSPSLDGNNYYVGNNG
jgi:hypothetical protein